MTAQAAASAASIPDVTLVQQTEQASAFLQGFFTGSFFWPVVAIAVIGLAISAGKGKGLWSTIFLVITGVLLAQGVAGLAHWVVSHPYWVVAIIVGYLAASIPWARFEWTRFINKKRETFVRVRDKFLKGHSLNMNWFETANHKTKNAEDFCRTLRTNGFPNIALGYDEDETLADVMHKVTPQASDSKADIIMWMMYWPVLVVWFILNDMLGEIFSAMYHRVAGNFQRASNAAFADVAPVPVVKPIDPV